MQFDYFNHMKQVKEKVNLTDAQMDELKALYVERIVDNMSTKDLVQYVMDDMTDYVNKQPDIEFIDEAYSYWDDYFDEIIDEVKEVIPNE